MEMKLKNVETMTVRFAHSWCELDSLAKFLEEKAAEGWELTSKTGIVFGFRKSRARKVKISVELVYADDNDSDNERFIEYCQAAGWRHIFSDGKLQIFENDDLLAEPIHTDPALKLATVHRKAKKSNLWAPGITFIIAAIWMKFFWSRFSYLYFASYGALLAMVGMPILMVLLAVQIGLYLRWYYKGKKAVESGRSPDYHKQRFTGIYDKVILVYVFFGIWGGQILDAHSSGSRIEFLITVIIYAVVLLLIICVPFLSARFGKERKGNFYKLLAIAVCVGLLLDGVGAALSDSTDEGLPMDEKPPLTLEDLNIDTKEPDYYCNSGGTFLARYLGGSDYSENEAGYSIAYEIGAGNRDKVCKWLMKSPEDFTKITDEAFGAEEVYLQTENTDTYHRWVLKYADKVVLLETDVPLSDGQKQIAAEAFRNIIL